jgi:hypothetical protein
MTMDKNHTRRNAMKAICKTAIYVCISALGAFCLATGADASARDLSQSYLHAKVIAHLPLTGSGARQMFLEREGRKQYLYVQQPSQQGFTVINVTKRGRPKVVSRGPLETLTVVGSGLVVTEIPDRPATVATSEASGNAEGIRGDVIVPESVRVHDVSDPAHPLTVQTFSGVTSVLSDNVRGLIYVANGEGIWILSQRQVVHRRNCGSSDAISFMPNCN